MFKMFPIISQKVYFHISVATPKTWLYLNSSLKKIVLRAFKNFPKKKQKKPYALRNGHVLTV